MNKFIFSAFAGFSIVIAACNSPTSIQETVAPNASQASNPLLRFAGGTKSVKIITSIASTGSFATPSTVPTPGPVPPNFPAVAGAQYLPGVSAVNFYSVDGVSTVTKPSWLTDFQLGITDKLPSSSCATFGGSGNADIANFYRVSEINCATSSGSGGNTDPVFLRLVLNRNATLIGTAENLLIQIEYQASGLRLNSDGEDNSNPENNLDQLWKVFWNTSLSALSIPNVFSVFVPPNYSACAAGGSQLVGLPGNCVNGYRGAPITVKQIIIPLSSYPALSEIQISRIKGRINQSGNFIAPPGTTPYSYEAPAFSGAASSDCQSDSPLCAGVVIRSVLLMRI